MTENRVGDKVCDALPSYLNEENIKRSKDGVEYHPLIPFLPENGKVLFLGSFPPQRKRWCMDFYYPNFINDHWRIEGLVFFGDKNYFVDEENKTFKLPLIIDFLHEKGIGFFDTSYAIRRLNDNASDKFLEVVESTDIFALIKKMPQLRTIVTTGEKATQTICEHLHIEQLPKVGTFVSVPLILNKKQESISLYRLPSSSRAYPLSLQKKADAYRKMFETFGLI
jgi:G:T/U-mismatch repair DNA glycosylase